MKILNQGTLLIDLLIYLALISVLGALGFTWLSRSQRNLLAAAQSSNALMQLYSVTDLLIRDLRSSPRNFEAWLKRTDTSIIWRGEKTDIGWYQEGKCLYRIEGSYRADQKQWSKKSRSVAIQNLEMVHFEITQLHTHIDKVEVAMVVHSGKTRHYAQETVYLREVRS